jgi:hypothetical protein
MPLFADNTSCRAVMARFQEWLMEQPLDKEIPEIPREFWPLIGMIGHESYVRSSLLALPVLKIVPWQDMFVQGQAGGKYRKRVEA